MLLHPALMVNEPHESQELVGFNPSRLYYESMMIWCIGLLHYISIILFSLSCYCLSASVPSRPSWNSLEIRWQPHWYFSWFLIFAQQECNKCSGLLCPHYNSPIKQLDALLGIGKIVFWWSADWNLSFCLAGAELASKPIIIYLVSLYCAFYLHLSLFSVHHR